MRPGASPGVPVMATQAELDALGAQRGDDVEPVAPIGDVHRVEEFELCGSDPGHQRRALPRRHARPQVRPELAGPRGPPGS